MSRWIDGFRDHAFQDSWNKIIIITEQPLILADKSISYNVIELARFKKVVKYIDSLLNASDPELIPLVTWDNFQGQAAQCLTQIIRFNQNKNIAHLKEANNNLDNLLSYIQPYVVNAKSAAQAAGRAFKTYADTISQEVEFVKREVSEDIANIELNLTRSISLLEEIKEVEVGAKESSSFLFDDSEGEDSLKTKMEALHEEVDDWHTDVSTYHDELFVGDDEEESLKLQIDTAKNEVLSDVEEIMKTLASVESNVNEFSVFYKKVFGVENEETGELGGGLQQELVDRKSDLDEFKKQQQEECKALIEQIETLLPGAVSAGLASAYKTLKDEFEWSMNLYSKVFYSSLMLLFVVSLVVIIDKIGWFYMDFVELNNLTVLSTSFVHKLPILGPVLWLAIFSSRRRSEAHRLQQEYAHKEAIAKSYQSFKKQIDSLRDNNDDLAKQLLAIAIKAIGYNASETLDRNHDEKPSKDILKKIMDYLSSSSVKDK